MDVDERRHHQYGPLYQVSSSAPANPTQQMPPPTSERYAQSPARAEVSRSSLNRPQIAGYAGYGFPEQQYSAPTLQAGSMQGVDMQYSPTYVQDTSRQQQMQQTSQQQYAQYGQNVILQPGPSQPVFESVPQYQQRQSAAIEVLTNQFGMSQYLPSSGQAGMASAQYITSQPEQAAYQQQLQPSRPPLSQTYPATSNQGSLIEQQYSQEPQVPDVTPDTRKDDWRRYKQELKATFDATRTGRVNEASENLMRISQWLLSSVVALGLHHDDESEQASRLEMWREFNLCWESLGLKQKDIIEEALRLRRDPTDFLTADRIREMVDDLISLCEGIAQHGLVDYDMGVWEEQITYIFGQCLDLLPVEEAAGQLAVSTA